MYASQLSTSTTSAGTTSSTTTGTSTTTASPAAGTNSSSGPLMSLQDLIDLRKTQLSLTYTGLSSCVPPIKGLIGLGANKLNAMNSQKSFMDIAAYGEGRSCCSSLVEGVLHRLYILYLCLI